MADLSAAFHQLYLLTGERDPAAHWQIFCDYDHAKKGLARSYYGTLSELAPTLKVAQEQGCGVFVAVHKFDGSGRRKENLMGIRALFLDFDGTPLPASWALHPDLILNSSPGHFQALWVLAETVDVPLWRSLQQQLQTLYGSDRHCRWTLTQVFRLAGYLHQKRRDRPHRVNIVHIASERTPKTMQEIAAAHGFELVPEPVAEHKQKPRGPRSKAGPIYLDAFEPPACGWDSPADVATVRRYLSDPANWKLKPTGGGVFRIACLCRDYALSSTNHTRSDVGAVSGQADHEAAYRGQGRQRLHVRKRRGGLQVLRGSPP